mgnify:CR=1 FL=1
MLNLNDHEKSRVMHLAQDKNTVEGLKTHFLKSFLRKREGDVHVKAAAGYAIDFLEEAFRELENMIEKEKNNEESKNIV